MLASAPLDRKVDPPEDTFQPLLGIVRRRRRLRKHAALRSAEPRANAPSRCANPMSLPQRDRPAKFSYHPAASQPQARRTSPPSPRVDRARSEPSRVGDTGHTQAIAQAAQTRVRSVRPPRAPCRTPAAQVPIDRRVKCRQSTPRYRFAQDGCDRADAGSCGSDSIGRVEEYARDRSPTRTATRLLTRRAAAATETR